MVTGYDFPAFIVYTYWRVAVAIFNFGSANRNGIYAIAHDSDISVETDL